MSTVSRITCPKCSTRCMEGEANCWQCGHRLTAPASEATPAETTASAAPAAPEEQPATKPAPKPSGGLFNGLLSRNKPPEAPPQPEKPLIDFEPGAGSSDQPTRQMRMTLDGEMVEVEDTPLSTATLNAAGLDTPTANAGSDGPIAATIGDTTIEGEATPIMYMTYCKICGHENVEGAKECFKCKSPLELVPLGGIPDIEPLPRAWGFDVLGVVWVVLGLAAIFCNQFLLRTNASAQHAGWADYFWTGVVACAPGFFIFSRFHFCKLLFWVLTLGSALVWSVIGVVWILGHLFVSDSMQVGLIWLSLFSGLSVISYLTVRLNDAFDYAP